MTAVKLPPWNLNSSTMMVSTGMATFHQVMPALTLLKMRMARKFSAVKMIRRTTVIAKPSPVTLPFPPFAVASNRPCQ